VLRHEPSNAKALFRRGLCHLHTGLLDEAKADLLAAKRLLPDDAKLNDALVKLRVRARACGCCARPLARAPARLARRRR
jgi:tetratricopeptide (TPR) repeat protein